MSTSVHKNILTCKKEEIPRYTQGIKVKLEQLRQAFDGLGIVGNALLMKVRAVRMLVVGIGEVSIERLPNVTDAPFDYLGSLLL